MALRKRKITVIEEDFGPDEHESQYFVNHLHLKPTLNPQLHDQNTVHQRRALTPASVITHTHTQLFNAPSSSLRKDFKMTAPYGPYAGWDFYFPAAPPPHPGFAYPQQMLPMQPAVQWQQLPRPDQQLEDDPLSERARKRGRFSENRCFVCDGFDHLCRDCAVVGDHVNMKVQSKVETQLADAADAVRQARLAVEEGGVGRRQHEAAMAKKDREIAGLKAKIALLEGEIKKETVSKPESQSAIKTDPAIKKEADGM